MSAAFPPEEGIGNYVYRLSKKLIENGHKVTIITRGSWKKTQKEVIDDIDVFRVRFIPLYPVYIHLHKIFVNKLFKSIESQIDIVHIHSPLSPLIKTSLPLITTIHTLMLTDYRSVKITSVYSLLSKISSKFVSYPLELKLLHNSDLITTVSESIAQEIKKYYLELDNIIIIGNGVDETIYLPAQKENVGGNKFIMYAGRMDREKGLFDLIECGRYLLNQRSDILFILAGKGPDYNKLKQKSKKLGLQENFIFLGQIGSDELIHLYQRSTLFVFPSYHEGLPGSLLEAMSCGLPIIATNVRGNRDLITSGENGILVPPRSPEKLANTISMLLDDDKLRKDLGNNARKKIEENFSSNIIYTNMLHYYYLLNEKNKI